MIYSGVVNELLLLLLLFRLQLLPSQLQLYYYCHDFWSLFSIQKIMYLSTFCLYLAYHCYYCDCHSRVSLPAAVGEGVEGVEDVEDVEDVKDAGDEAPLCSSPPAIVGASVLPGGNC